MGAIVIRRTEEGTNGAVISDLGNHALDPDVVHCIIRKPFDLGTFMALFVATAAEMCESRRRLANVVAFPQPNAG